MARDAVAVSVATVNVGLANPAGVAITPANGVSVSAGGSTRKPLIRVTNTAGAPKNVTVRAGVNPPAQRQSIGDLVVAVPATTGDVLLAVESARFEQADGSVWLDFDAGMTGVVSAVRRAESNN